MGGPDVVRITTSAGQGQAREGLSEGSPSAKVRAEEHESHRRLSPGASQHLMTKPAESRGRVNAAVVHRQRMFLFGEICPTWRWAVEAKVTSGAALVDQGPGAASRCRLQRAKQAVAPKTHTARRAAMRERDRIEVSRGRSSRDERRRAEHESRRRSAESLARGVEPGRGSRGTA